MNFLAKSSLAELAVATFSASPASAAGIVVFDFEGIDAYVNNSDKPIASFYASNYASFAQNAVVYCLNTLGIDCPTATGPAPTPVGNKSVQSLKPIQSFYTAGNASRDGNTQGPQ